MQCHTINFFDHGYQIKQLRKQIFINELNIDIDDIVDKSDATSYHVGVFFKDQLIASSRLTNDGQIGRVVVKKEYRNLGFGTLMLQELISIAHDLNMDELSLITTSPVNHFYEKQKFVKEKELHAYSIDCMKMTKKL